MAACLVVHVAAGCGRVSFEEAAFDASGGSADNCPGSDDPQHDEDGDGIDDACDPCPHVAGTASDEDGDGLGDACDPAPTVGGNAIIAFVPFDRQPAGWEEVPATAWSYADDRAAVALVGQEYAILSIPTVGDVTLSTRVVVTSVSPNMMGQNSARNFAVVDNYDTTTDSGLFAGVVQDWSRGAVEMCILRVTNSIGSANYDTVLGNPMLTLGVPYDVTYVRTGSTLDVTVTGPEPGSPAQLTATQPDSGGRIGIRSRGLTAAFEYVIVIR